jgi:hypothetical protein
MVGLISRVDPRLLLPKNVPKSNESKLYGFRRDCVIFTSTGTYGTILRITLPTPYSIDFTWLRNGTARLGHLAKRVLPSIAQGESQKEKRSI